MGTLEQRSRTFDEVADLYDRFRPGYPAALADDVIRLSGIPAGGRILEIGCSPHETERFIALAACKDDPCGCAATLRFHFRCPITVVCRL